ncbi:MAG: DUF2142 domain-containing protein [Myxococcota bacterium]
MRKPSHTMGDVTEIVSSVKTRRFVRCLEAAMLVIVFACVAIIGIKSRVGVHPDEPLHIDSARYFQDHWLPPRANDEFIPYLDPAYGVSYALSVPPEAVYFVYGKVGAIVTAAGGSFSDGCRYAALLLFALLCGWLVVKRPEHPAHAFVLLATPQVWYVFAYVNGDAFGMFASFWVVWQLGNHQALGRRYIESASSRWGILTLGLAFAALALCKRNYVPFFMYALAYGTLITFRDRGRLQRWALSLGIGALIAGSVLVFDEARNGFDKEGRALALREAHAMQPWKQSSIDNGTAMNGLGLRQKGVPLMDVVGKPWNWAEGVYKTFLGVYGPMSIWFPPWEYVLRGLAFLALALLALWGARGSPLSLAAALAMGCGVIVAALNFAWTYDFQPQGRYIFAIIPIIALAWTHDTRPPKRLAWALLFIAFLLGYRSMLTLGIPELLGAHFV